MIAVSLMPLRSEFNARQCEGNPSVVPVSAETCGVPAVGVAVGGTGSAVDVGPAPTALSQPHRRGPAEQPTIKTKLVAVA